MCGIAGIYNFNNVAPAGAIQEITGAISHRGPDAQGFFESDRVCLGHKRLSIIDLFECSNQPLVDESGRYRIIFNGEIYNFVELRTKLAGYPFRSKGDTEVLLAAFIKWGPACLEMLKGMFAFAIWDDEKKEMFLARDRFGVKPLYYYKSPKHFIFASETRAILKSKLVPARVNKQAIAGFLQFQSVGADQTVIEGIKSLHAGSYMLVNTTGVHIHRYWNVVPVKPDFDFSDRSNVRKKIYDLLLMAVERRMISDVPLGAFLSGGIDSSAIVGLMSQASGQKVNTFTVGFEEKEFDESYYAELVAKRYNTNHQRILLQPSSFLDELIPALNAMDTPSGDGVNSYVVSKAIRNSGIKVALSGVGGDELFAGYPIFLQYIRLMRLKRIWKPLKPVRRLVADVIPARNVKKERISKVLSTDTARISSFYPAFRQIVSPTMLSDCTTLEENEWSINGVLSNISDSVKKLPLLSQVSVAEYLGYTQNTLLKDMDQMSMASSLEVREPFFDHDLVEFVLHVPDDQKYPVYPKKLLVEALNGLLPNEIVHRKKQGFLFPWKEWMKNELRSFCEAHLVSISHRDFINGPQLMLYWKRFLCNDLSVRWTELWLFVVLEYWLTKNNVGEE